MQKKLFLTYVAIILFLSSFIGFYAVKICKQYYTADYKKQLLNESKIAATLFEQQFQSLDETTDLDIYTDDFSKQFGFRVTVIDEKGKVLSDSQENPEDMENHRNREEVKKALEGNATVQSRYSSTLRTQYIYAAVPVKVGNENLILRFSRPLLALKTVKNEMIYYILFSIIICSIIAFFTAYYFSKRISEPLDELTKAVEQISAGNYNKKIYVESNGQIGSLTNAFNHMSSKLNTFVRQLEYENKKMEAIVNSMINGVVAVDGDNKILVMNSMCYSLFDIPLNHNKGCDFSDFFDDLQLHEIIERSRRGRQTIVEEIFIRSQYHSDRILCVYANPIAGARNKKNQIGILLVFQDMTQIRKLEQLRSDFVSNVTHELKTPLTSIIGFTDTLKQGAIQDKEAALRFLDIIDIETKRLYRLIEDILSLSEIETRNEDVNVYPESIRKILFNVEELLRPQAEIKGLKLETFIDDEIPLFLCNRDRISQMLINLIENAIKYTEKGWVRVYCKNQESFLEIIVKDTGIGIPKESQARIFERFYRVDKGRSRKAGGTGLGLSIVKHILMLYGGRITLQSEEGKGSQFTISLPYEKSTFFK